MYCCTHSGTTVCAHHRNACCLVRSLRARTCGMDTQPHVACGHRGVKKTPRSASNPIQAQLRYSQRTHVRVKPSLQYSIIRPSTANCNLGIATSAAVLVEMCATLRGNMAPALAHLMTSGSKSSLVNLCQAAQCLPLFAI